MYFFKQVSFRTFTCQKQIQRGKQSLTEYIKALKTCKICAIIYIIIQNLNKAFIVLIEVVNVPCMCCCVKGFWADRTALHEAASHGRALQLKQLIESGSSVNMVTVDNITPLHEACIKAHPNCARLLLEAGAQVVNLHGSDPTSCGGPNPACVDLEKCLNKCGPPVMNTKRCNQM